MAQVDLYNQALGVCGSRAKLTSTVDKTREAEVCNIFYDDVRINVFSSAWWPSLRHTSALTLVAERDSAVDWTDGDPAPQWRYAFRLPAGHLRPRFLANYEHFTLESWNDETTLQTNVQTPILTYTKNVTDTGRWDPLLRSLVVATLALSISRPLGVDAKAYQRVVDNFQMQNNTSMTTVANQERPEILETIPDWIAIRGGGAACLPVTRFFYPTQALLYGPSQVLV